MNLRDVIKRPVITEKSMRQASGGQYVFMVDRRATKSEIKKALKDFFQVHPLKIRTMKFKGKIKRVKKYQRQTTLSDWKKAIVSLKEGEKIDLFEMSE
ncbi:MAG: 50S ribosomal protein L23 [Candidatus Pacebacteria bacterium]|nr:50S ribosomal protein L23 [Candidatus Paceibacterota bacterium]